jgi:hypothetical protein
MSAALAEAMSRGGMVVPDSLAVDVFPCGATTIRGIRATRDIQKGEELLRVPYSMLLNADNCLRAMPLLEAAILSADAANSAREEAEGTPSSKCCGPSLISKSEFVMGCYLVACAFDADMRSASPFRALIELLPKQSELPMIDLWLVTEFQSPDVHCPEFLAAPGSHTAMSLSREQMIALLGSNARFLKLARRVEKHRHRFLELKGRYFDQAPAFFRAGVFTFPHWLWATTIINSRSFQYSRPKFSDYPRRYMTAMPEEPSSSRCSSDEDDEDDDDESESDGGGKEVDEDALVLACERAVAHAKQHPPRAAPMTLPGRLAVKPRRQTIGGPANSSDDSSDDDGRSRHAANTAERVLFSRIPTEEESAVAEAGRDLYTLLPFGDMFNHDDSGSQDFGLDEKQGAFIIKSDRALSAGEQVFIKYNSMDHWRFAKYYGFVAAAPPISNAEPTGCNRNDAFPVAIPLPPRRAGSSAGASVLEITKSLLFEDPLLRKHCYVTSKGPNQSLLSGLRLLHLGEAEFSKYTLAFQKDMISVRNEWHAFKFLVDAVGRTLSEVKRHRNALNAAGTCGLSERAQVAVAVRDRDFRVLSAAHKVCQTAYRSLCELLYYGATADSVLRSNPLHAQLVKLRSLQRVPLTQEQLVAMGLGDLPLGDMVDGVIGNPFRSAQTGVDDIADVLHRRLTQPGRKPLVW